MERLYKWEVVETRTVFKDECDYIESELRLNHYGIRTRVKISQEGCLELWVPMKDVEVAKAVLSKEVKEIVDEQKEFYHVFDEQLGYKRKRQHSKKYGIKSHFLEAKRYAWMGFMILILLLLFKFFRF